MTATAPRIDDARRRHDVQAPARVPPHDLPAEESLLGAMLLDRRAIESAVGVVTADDFYKPAHAHIFEAVTALYGRGEPSDPVTVVDELRRAKHLEYIGEPSTLITLQAGTPSIGSAAKYAEIIARKSQLRRVAGAAGAVVEALYTGTDAHAQIEALRAVVGMEAAESADRLRSVLVQGDAILDMPSPAPLVGGILDLDTLALLYGPSGSTKTFVALDLALSVATGSWWMGRAVEPGPVLYVVAEGLGGIGDRVKAWQQQRQVHTCGETFWLPMAVGLLDVVAVDGLVGLARELKPRLVVLDTLARCMVGGDENTARDIGMAVEAGERLRRACGGCVLLVHHSGKDASAGARGSSALRGAVATEIEVSHADGVTTLRQTKQREHAPAEPIRLSLVPVGESCALYRYTGEGQTLPKGAVEMLAELQAIVTDDDGVSGSVWRASSTVAERSFYRWQKSLIDLGYCHKTGSKAQARFTVSDLGKEVLAS